MIAYDGAQRRRPVLAARELGCAVCTVWGDLHVLQEAGFPIYDERDGRRGVWEVENGFGDRLPLPGRRGLPVKPPKWNVRRYLWLRNLGAVKRELAHERFPPSAGEGLSEMVVLCDIALSLHAVGRPRTRWRRGTPRS